MERHPVDTLPPDPNRDSVPRRLYLKQRDFLAHGTQGRCPGCRALVIGGRAQGHTEECRIRVERELRKTEEGKTRLRAAASRVGDALTGRALKRVRFAADRVEDDAETPEATSVSTIKSPCRRCDDQFFASAFIRGCAKRSSDSSHSESETKRLHTDQSTRDVVMLLDDSDVGRAGFEQCREVCRRGETFLVNVTNCVPAAQMVRLLLAPVVEPPENSCRMNRVFSIFLLLPLMVMVVCRGKPSGSVLVNTNMASLGAVGHCEEFNPVLVHRAKMEDKKTSLTRWESTTLSHDPMLRGKDAVNKGSDDAPQLRARWFAQEFRGRCGDKHEYFSETPDLP